ncbi:hypothetical protein YC2023_087296 [Brassica napus]
MQCTPDLSKADCNLCLQESVNFYQQFFLGQEGGIIMRLSCFLRTELYPFFGAFQDIVARSPLSQPVSKPPTPPTPPLANRSNVTKSTGITSVHSLQFDFKTIEAATDKFAMSNKVGQGGFGQVYKGMLPNGTEIAVKRLSKTSSQGAQEFKNEVVVVAKLQHRNLVRLLGYCLEGEEKILVYEFVANKSLDYFLFGMWKKHIFMYRFMDYIHHISLNIFYEYLITFECAEKRQFEDWKKRYNIIGGITGGIIYLHQDSRLTIIHRDLKASNILLDADMNPKIADFGMARIFGMDQSGANTSRIVGTHGYMPPEYLIHGQFSMKSDVYSFGVLVEIISGRKNSSFHQTSDATAENFVTQAWKLWKNGSPLELVDPNIVENYQIEEVTRCIHIALLCVQEDPTDRPNLSTITLMLTSNTLILPVPQPPGFFLQNRRNQKQGLEELESSQSTISEYSNGSQRKKKMKEKAPLACFFETSISMKMPLVFSLGAFSYLGQKKTAVSPSLLFLPMAWLINCTFKNITSWRNRSSLDPVIKKWVTIRLGLH